MTKKPNKNRLSETTSPYLLQHKDNPVFWQIWNDETFATARALDMPILLSVGYAACHWCHVMAHESFENPEIAQFMNAHFICIKLDREERPDIDDIYMKTLALMGTQTGWPLTMFLDPHGKPFWGGTYFPPHSRNGQTGFMEIMKAINTAYQNDRAKISQNSETLQNALRESAKTVPQQDIDSALPARAAKSILPHIDMEKGGFHHAPKFPQPFFYEFLWRHYLSQQDLTAKNAVTSTLRQICRGGIYDHIGGGFARYAVDADWLIPHFEKMLYDNALLIRLLCLVWKDTREPLFARAIGETINWLKNDMQLSDGAFAASLDADSENEEGIFYLWTKAEIEAALTEKGGVGERAAKFCAAYNVTEDGNFEGKNILNRLRNENWDENLDEAFLEERAILHALRQARIHPAQDDKILADWNGLIIAALAEAGFCFDRADWVKLAEQAFAEIITASQNADGGLYHSCRANQHMPIALAEDYVFMAEAALILYSVTGKADYLSRAEIWLEKLVAYQNNEGSYVSSPPEEQLIVQLAPIQDNATPSLNGALLSVFTRAFILTGNPLYRERAEQIRKVFAGQLPQNYMSMTAFLNGHDFLENHISLIITGDKEDKTVKEFIRLCAQYPSANLVSQYFADTTGLPPAHPAFAKSAKDGRATAYICQNQSCSPPITKIADLQDRLDHFIV